MLYAPLEQSWVAMMARVDTTVQGRGEARGKEKSRTEGREACGETAIEERSDASFGCETESNH
jgi:hypothetical protein